MGRHEHLRLLEEGGIPERYQRNIGTIGIAGQIRLLKAKVAIIGAGGLGGNIIELLARQGVGYLRIIDGDTFATHNLNRQLLSTEGNLGMNKAEAAVGRVALINSDIEATATAVMFNEENATQLLEGVDVVVDALDNLSSRLLLGRTARHLGLPLVHGAIAGFTGLVTTIFPEDPGLEKIYNFSPETDRGVETTLGNPAATPALAAAIQAQEVIKLVTGVGEPLRNRILYFDAESNIYKIINLS